MTPMLYPTRSRLLDDGGVRRRGTPTRRGGPAPIALGGINDSLDANGRV